MNCREINESHKDFINEIVEKYKTNTISNFRVYVRQSGTEPVLRVLVEAKNGKEVDYLSKKITYEIDAKINKIPNDF